MPSLLYKSHQDASKLTRSLADHLITRMYYGKTVIVVDNPRVFIAVLRKQWLRQIRKLKVERSRTLNPAKVAELNGTVSYMANLRFTTLYPLGDYPGDVYIVNTRDALNWAPDCITLYLLSDVETHERYLLTSWMPAHSLVVLYEK